MKDYTCLSFFWEEPCYIYSLVCEQLPAYLVWFAWGVEDVFPYCFTNLVKLKFPIPFTPFKFPPFLSYFLNSTVLSSRKGRKSLEFFGGNLVCITTPIPSECLYTPQNSSFLVPSSWFTLFSFYFVC